MIKTVFNGLCMALADSVPGVSGGTIAFILGFYDRFINSLHSLMDPASCDKKEALEYLVKLGLGWIIGMAGSVAVLSALFEKNIYFMSSMFLGLTIASIPFIVHSEHKAIRKHAQNSIYTLIGFIVVASLALLRSGNGLIGSLQYGNLNLLQYVYIFLSGMIAISAMVLPGISGSTVLLIAGVYLPTIHAVKSVMTMSFAVLPGLIALALGILAGIFLSVRFIQNSLYRHRSRMIYLILGLMLGSIVAIILGPTTLDVPAAALSLQTFRITGFLTGIALLIALEYIKRLSKEEIA